MATTDLTPMGDNGSFYFSTTFSGTTLTDVAISADLKSEGNVWLQMSCDNTDWFNYIGVKESDITKSLIAISNINTSLVYRVCTTQLVNSLLLIS